MGESIEVSNFTRHVSFEGSNLVPDFITTNSPKHTSDLEHSQN
jgi:hypothetical protein